MVENSFRLKQIQHQGRDVMICLQNENGPCPLLAISNVLLLRGAISLHKDLSFVKTEQLMTLIGDFLLKSRPTFVNEEMQVNYEKNVQDCIASFPQLAVGLNVNVRFTSITDFEFTKECLIFDLLGIRLVHGWLVDPADSVTYSLLKNLSYNQLIERIVFCRSPVNKPKVRHEKVLLQTESCELRENVATVEYHPVEVKQQISDENQTNSASSPTSLCPNAEVPMTPSKNLNNEDDNAMTEPNISNSNIQQAAHTLSTKILEKWLEDNRSQMTYYGLFQLHQNIRENELCVLFRNNHFSTLYKHDGKLFLLVTDLGYLREPNIVWERLDQIDGDTVFFTSTFEVCRPSPSCNHNSVSVAVYVL
jgi:hypothetical protein